MQRSDDKSVQGASGDRVLNLRALRFHNAHLSIGDFSSRHCSVCSEGLEGFMETPAPVAAPEVAAGNGGDKEGDSPSPRGDGPHPDYYDDQVLG